MNFEKATLLDLWNFLEQLDYEASVLNKNTTELLEKAKLNSNMKPQTFNLLNNTLLAMKKGDITLNQNVITPYEKQEASFTQYAIDISQAYLPTSSKDVERYLREQIEWEVVGVNSTTGTQFQSWENPNISFSYDITTGCLRIPGSEKQFFKQDFTHVLAVAHQGIYFLKKVSERFEGANFILISQTGEKVCED